MYLTVAVFAAIGLLYSAISARIDRSTITGPIIFLTLGVLLGPSVLGVLSITLDSEVIRIFAEYTLALVLFTDAMRTDLGSLRSSRRVPIRMLLIGLPLTIVAGTVAGTLIFPAIPLVEVAILATMLAPTDAALGKSVLEDKNIPASIRTCLNVESGLNDGLSVPILFALLAAASHASSGGFGALTLGYLVEEVGIGVIVGGVVATAAFYILREGESRGWIGHSWRAILLVALAVAIFSLTQHVEGSGFIAVFVGGLILNNLHPDHKGSLLHGAEGVGELMAMSTWVIFGAIVVPLAIVHFTWQILLYIVLSLTVVRMLPIAISLIGSGIGPRTSVFLGWFGPRGLASIVFGVMIIGKGLTFQEPLILVVTCAVILSVFVHGASATMLGERLGPRLKEIEAG